MSFKNNISNMMGIVSSWFPNTKKWSFLINFKNLLGIWIPDKTLFWLFDIAFQTDH